MNFSHQLPIASMMILLFVSGLSVVRSEESQKVENIKGIFGKGVEEAAISIKKIDPRSEESQKVAEIKGLFGKGMEKATISLEKIEPYTAAEVCASISTHGDCNSWSSPTGLFSLTYTNNNGGVSQSYIISDSLWNQIINNYPNFAIGNYLNTNDLYLCTGTYDSTTNAFIPASGDCDLTKKSVDSGKTYYFLTSSTNYTWSISFPLGGGAIAGIVIGVLVFLGCCCGGLAFLIMNRKKTAQPQTTVIALGPGQTQQNPTVVTTNAV